MGKVFTFFKGRVALYAILKSMGIGDKDEVILPGFTCVVVPNAISYTGAIPVYVDIDIKNFNIDVDKIEEKISKNTKAIIAQHTFGIPAEMDEIKKLCKKYNLFLIEDACHCLGSKYKGEELGTIGDASFFSSQWSKPITTGLGGWAKINNDELLKKMEKEYEHFIPPTSREESLIELQYKVYSKLLTPKIFWTAQSIYRKVSSMGFAVGSSTDDELEYEKPSGFEKRMGKKQITILNQKLSSVKEMISHRVKITNIYKEFFPEEYSLYLSENSDIVFLRFPILVEDKKGILVKARKEKIEIGDWFLSPLHPNMDGWEKVKYKKGSCKIAEEVCEHIINLPTHEKISESEAKRIADFVKKHRGTYEYPIS